MRIEEYGLRVLKVYSDTIADGEGIRYSIYLAGCNHRCPKCHNRASWNRLAGQLLDEARLGEMIGAIQRDPLLDGITLSGGDPFFNPVGLAALLCRLRDATGQSVWCYTGYTIEEIASRPPLQLPLPYIDVLVDGPYIDALRDPTLPFRGSSNQRLIRNPLAHVADLQRR